MPIVESDAVSSRKFRTRRLYFAICLGSFVIAETLASAAGREGENRKAAFISFDIASQPLEQALDIYSSASDVQVLYETSLTSGRRSTKVRGLFTPESALKALLSGTGLSARYTTKDSYTLVQQKATASLGEDGAPLPPEVARYDHFLGLLQGRILDALCRNADTQPGHYRIKLSFRVGPSGAFLQTSLLDSTGDSDRDAAIVEAVEGLTVDQAPPSELPQPITMVVAPRPPEATGDCASVNGTELKR
jgi:hypothetical protein